MPYELSFTKKLAVPDPEQYINECCWGGDVVSEELLPLVRDPYTGLDAGQEDWGWYIWFERGSVRLAIDTCCDDPAAGSFRVRLTSRIRRRLLPDRIEDTPELEELLTQVRERLQAWGGTVAVEHVDD